MEETDDQGESSRQTGARSLQEQIDQAASELDAALARNDLTGFYDWFRASDLPFIALAQRDDALGLTQACCRILHRLGGLSPAVAMALENHFYVTSALVTFPIGDPALEERRQLLVEDLESRRLLVANTNPRIHGDKLGAFGMNARREGDGFRVKGSAAYLSLATQGDLLVFLCTLEDEGPAIFVTPLRNNPEVEIGPLLFSHAMADSDTRRVTFHDLALSKSDLLMSGQTEQMSQLLGFELIWHQLLISALYLGAAARAIEEVRLFLRSVRHADDRPLAELDGMVVDTGRLVLRYRTAWGAVERASEALGNLARYPLVAEDLENVLDMASIAKHTGTIVAEEVVTAARRIIGARSFACGHPLERLSQEAPFGPLGPELNAAIERRLGRQALGEVSFLVHHGGAGLCRTGRTPSPRHPVRRRNRAVEDETWIRGFLRRAPTCVLATVHDGWPFLNPNLFVFDEASHALYVHTAGVGRTHSNIEADGRACVCVSEMGRLLPGPKVTDYSVEYASVVMFGKATIVSDRAEARWVFERQLEKYFPHIRLGLDYETFTDEEMRRASVYRIDIERWSAKQHREPEDFPGAVLYAPAPPIIDENPGLSVQVLFNGPQEVAK